MSHDLRRALAAAAAAALITAACGDSTAPADLPAELIGTWVAEPACLPVCGLTLSSEANPDDSLGVTAIGITTQITIGANGSFLIETIPQLPGTVLLNGTARAEGSTLYVTLNAGVEESMQWSVGSGTVGGATVTLLTLHFRGSYDFDGDGTAEPALAEGVFRKR